MLELIFVLLVQHDLAVEDLAAELHRLWYVLHVECMLEHVPPDAENLRNLAHLVPP